MLFYSYKLSNTCLLDLYSALKYKERQFSSGHRMYGEEGCIGRGIEIYTDKENIRINKLQQVSER